MAQYRSYARWGGEERSGGDGNADTTTATPPTTTAHITTVPSVDAAELAAGRALNEGFRLLQYQLAGVPLTLQALLRWVERGKVATILTPAAMALGATLTRKLNRTTGDWHREAHADRSRVVRLLKQSARSFCAANNDSRDLPYGASPDVSGTPPCPVWIFIGHAHFAALRGAAKSDGDCRGVVLLSL